MKRILKQVLGVDVDHKNLVVCFGRLDDDLNKEICAHKTVPNNSKGFTSLIKWVEGIADSSVEVHYLMEATGVYHEAFAYFLDVAEKKVSVVLPNKISSYFRTLDVKTVTDRTSSEAITQFGLERNLSPWHRPNPILKKVKQLTRERDQLVTERTLVKNQLHAEKSEAEPHKPSLVRMKKRIALLIKQEREILSEIRLLIDQDAELQASVKLVSSVPGIGHMTAATVLAETNGFDLIRNKRQLISYAGLDVKEKLSGTSVKGKPRISKRGNRHLRKAMHMPALAAIRSDRRYKDVFTRLVGKHGIRMKAVVAVQRKILELTYIVYKTRVAYSESFLSPGNSPMSESGKGHQS
jgi:transposase